VGQGHEPRSVRPRLIPMSRPAAHRPTWRSSVGRSFPFHPVTRRTPCGQTPTAMGAGPVTRSGAARTQFAETDSHSWARIQEPAWPLQPGRFLAGSTIHPRDHRSAVVLGRQPGPSRSVRGGGRTRFHCRQGFTWPDGKSWPSNEARVLGLPTIAWLHFASCPSLERRAGAFAGHRTLLETLR